MANLLFSYYDNQIEAGIDEAGRGCLAGPVVAAAVILPQFFTCETLNDSKQLSKASRDHLRAYILSHALAWKVAFVSHERIDEINILQATYEAMHTAVDGLTQQPDFLVIDGNRFKPHRIPSACVVKGDAKYLHIAAASILAKTFRDEYMEEIDAKFPMYGWKTNKGYPTLAHKQAIHQHGLSPYHRKTFNWRIQEEWTLFDSNLEG